MAMSLDVVVRRGNLELARLRKKRKGTRTSDDCDNEESKLAGTVRSYILRFSKGNSPVST